MCPLSCCLYTRDRQTLRSYTGTLSSRGSLSAPHTVDSMCLGRSVCESWSSATATEGERSQYLKFSKQLLIYIINVQCNAQGM